MKKKHFIVTPRSDGIVDSGAIDDVSIQVYRWGCSDLSELNLRFNGSKFGFISSGEAKLMVEGDVRATYSLCKGMYFLCPCNAVLQGGAGFLVNVMSYDGMFMIGGPIESQGRLKYINGCSDTLLIPPDKKGNPCFNYLHFPEETSQTQHTHPSVRVGMIAGGSGKCLIPADHGRATSNSEEEIELSVGVVFVIPANSPHRFITNGEAMDVIAFHPDSDMGPEDCNHPMINRTIIGGTSAVNVESIRTRDLRQ